MLYKETVSETTLELLIRLMQDVLLTDFFLVGGTALSLQIGHRISIDIDLFSNQPFNSDQILDHLESNYSYRLDYRWGNTLKGNILNVKVDLISHQYPLVSPILNIDQIRTASLEDIAAMKLSAISDNGTRLKDFIDIAYLSSKMSLTQMVNAYQKKYSSRNPAMLIKALDYHQDIDFTDAIQMTNSGYTWESVKKRINMMTMQPHQLFTTDPLDI